jgi:hypothetical protein
LLLFLQQEGDHRTQQGQPYHEGGKIIYRRNHMSLLLEVPKQLQDKEQDQENHHDEDI